MSEGDEANAGSAANQGARSSRNSHGGVGAAAVTGVGDQTFAEQRTSYRGEELTNGRNPKAVDQLGIQVLLGFRRKVFTLAVMQCFCVLVLAWAMANIPFVSDMNIAYTTDNMMRDGIIIGVSWLAALICLVALSAVRHSYPQNMLGLAVFTVFISWAIAVLAGPNIHLGLGIILVGFLLTGVLTSIPFGGRVIEVFPVAVCVMLLTNTLCLVWHFTFNTFIGLFWVVLLMIMNTVAVAWAGFQLDFLSSRLMVDEYLLPVILMWAELMVAMFIMISVEAMASNAGECGDSCYMWGHTTWHCDCWIYADGSHGSDRYRREHPPSEQEAPPQEEMPSAAPLADAPAAPPADAPAAPPAAPLAAPAASVDAPAPSPQTVGATDGNAV